MLDNKFKQRIIRTHSLDDNEWHYLKSKLKNNLCGFLLIQDNIKIIIYQAKILKVNSFTRWANFASNKWAKIKSPNFLWRLGNTKIKLKSLIMAQIERWRQA